METNFDSNYSIKNAQIEALGGTPSMQFDSVYSQNIEILRLLNGISGSVIDDSSVSLNTTWSSSKIASEIVDVGFDVQIVTELPNVGDPHIIYFILKSDPSTGDTYDEWMYINNNWEKVGNTQIDLSAYATIASVNSSLALKQDTLTAGQNITIDASNNISALGYIYNASNGSFKHYSLDYENSGVNSNIVTGINSVAFGTNNQAIQPNAFAEGQSNIASGEASHVEGSLTVASGSCAHAEGGKTESSAFASHAEGYNTIASGIGAHAEGYGGNAYKNVASGNGSHVEGCCTTAQNQSEHAQGSSNLSHKASDTQGDAGNTLHSIGDSYLMDVKHNALEVMQNADLYIKGLGGYQGTDTKVQNASIMTVQEVINGKADVYEVATTADILALFAMPTFYIDSSLYKTYGNLNWAQWLSSKYNTANYTHIYNASSYDSTIEQIPEVDSSAYPVQNGQYYSTCENTYVPATGPADDEIWYTTESGNLWEPFVDYGDGAESTLLRVNNGNVTILSNNYVNGHGVIKYSEPITSLDYFFGKQDDGGSLMSTDLTTLTIPNSITFVDFILDATTPQLESIYYNGTVAECEEIGWDSYDAVAVNDINEIICLDGTYSLSDEGGGDYGGGGGDY